MNLEQLKSELKEKEKGCGKDFSSGNAPYLCGKEDIVFEGFELCPTCKAEISALKKGIEAVEQRDKEELDILVNNIEQVKSFIKLNIPNVEDKYIIVNCFSGMIKRQMDLEQQLTNSEGKDGS